MLNSQVVNLYPLPSGETDESLTVGATAVSLTAGWSRSKCKYVAITVAANPVMVTFDGSDPTTTNGHYIPKETGIMFWHREAARLAKFISQNGSNAIVHATPFTV